MEKPQIPDFQPFHDYLLIKEISSENRMGAFITPTSSKNLPIKAMVLNVGRGRVEFGNEIPLESNIGDIIYVDRFQATELYHEGETFLLIRENAVLGRFNDPS